MNLLNLLAVNDDPGSSKVAPDFITIQNTGTPGVSFPSQVGDIITKVLPYIFGVAAFLLLIYLLIGGLQMMTSQGDPKAMQGAQGKITNALIGFIVVIISAIIVALLGKILNIRIFPQLF